MRFLGALRLLPCGCDYAALRLLAAVCLCANPSLKAMSQEMTDELPCPANFAVHSRQWRIDLVWEESSAQHFELQFADVPEGPFRPLHTAFHKEIPAYSDFIGEAGVSRHYRVRAVRPGTATRITGFSRWSKIGHGTSKPYQADGLLTEIQEAGWRYFYDYGHPVSGLAREGAPRNRELCAIGATGMGWFNLIVGVQRDFSTRDEAAARVLKSLRFLAHRAERFHGAFPHWIHGTTGKVIPFSRYDDGADLVETAYLAQGLLCVREFFSGENVAEAEIRSMADRLWREIEWDWFVSENEQGAFLFWHWSPTHTWRMNLPIRGFNECQITYVLALASPTHKTGIRVYKEGWHNARFSQPRTQFGIEQELGRGVGFPLFFTHYSYLGFDPRQTRFNGKTYFDHFRAASTIQVRYAQSRRNDFAGYGSLWGLTSSLDPDGYKAHAPGTETDNGTLSPTAALSSMPYVPANSLSFLTTLYREHGRRLWGPFGFVDAFNFSQDWVAQGFLGIDVGPIAPMIENYRTGMCWATFTRAPEIQSVLPHIADIP
jgi:hypothetical protein